MQVLFASFLRVHVLFLENAIFGGYLILNEDFYAATCSTDVWKYRISHILRVLGFVFFWGNPKWFILIAYLTASVKPNMLHISPSLQIRIDWLEREKSAYFFVFSFLIDD